MARRRTRRGSTRGGRPPLRPSDPVRCAAAPGQTRRRQSPPRSHARVPPFCTRTPGTVRSNSLKRPASNFAMASRSRKCPIPKRRRSSTSERRARAGRPQPPRARPRGWLPPREALRPVGAFRRRGSSRAACPVCSPPQRLGSCTTFVDTHELCRASVPPSANTRSILRVRCRRAHGQSHAAVCHGLRRQVRQPPRGKRGKAEPAAADLPTTMVSAAGPDRISYPDARLGTVPRGLPANRLVAIGSR